MNHTKHKILELGSENLLAYLLNDISNAFGSSDDGIIIKAFATFFGLKPIRWWRSFLIQTEALFQCHGKSGKIFKTSPRGYPQGSNASPGSFLMLMRGLHDSFKGSGHLYTFADDTTFCTWGETKLEIQKNLQDFLNFFEKFCEAINIKVNAAKTQLCPLQLDQRNNSDLKVKLCNEKIQEVDKFNLLGLNINNKLNFKPHFKIIVDRLKKKTYQVIKNIDKCSYQFAKILIQAYMQSTASHGLAYLPKPDRATCTRINAQINKPIRNKFATSEERKDRKKCRKIKQWKILSRVGLSSFENTARVAKLTELNKIARTGLPVTDFSRLVKCFEDLGETRRNRGIPVLTSRPRVLNGLREKIHECQPYDAVKLLNQLPFRIKSLFGTKEFDHVVKDFFHTICQHTESSDYRCDNCGLKSVIFDGSQIKDIDCKQLYLNGLKHKRWTKTKYGKLEKFFTENSENRIIQNNRHKLIQQSLKASHRFIYFVRCKNFWPASELNRDSLD